MAAERKTAYRWLRTGSDALSAILEAIHQARHSVRLESYIFAADSVGERFREALVQAVQRGCRVATLIDSFGSIGLSTSFWKPLVEAGGQFRWFNPLSLRRVMFRNHRKLVVVDDRTAFIGGFNVATAWDGDGVTQGWHDLGIQIDGPIAAELAASFDQMFERAEFRHRRFMRLRKAAVKELLALPEADLLLNGPGRGFNPIKHALHTDLAHAGSVQIIAAYFLPTWRIRRELMRLARRGKRVQILLPGQSDVPLMRLAARFLYQRLLRAGVEIFEYQPQILHGKLILIDDLIYVGSANLDTRSLHINYELVVRLRNKVLAGEARGFFAADLERSHRIELETWKCSRGVWDRWRERWAYFILARIDPYVARWQARNLQ